jgi:hypothetical protein
MFQNVAAARPDSGSSAFGMTMGAGMWTIRICVSLTLVGLALGNLCSFAPAQTATSRIDDALQNITTLVRPGRVGYASVWDGNKYVQCRRLPTRELRCEAAGSLLQPSLQAVLTPERLHRLTALGWTLDPSFGNYARVFPADMPTGQVAEHIRRTLAEAYDADIGKSDVQTAWVADIACPPRNGPSQNLAGLVNDAPEMRATALRTCTYAARAETPQKADSPAELIALYGPTVTAEIQRLRINSKRRVFVVFSAGIGYVQCAPDVDTASIYCEAQSAESWPALAAVLTPERVSLLHKAGYADPGRAPNYWKSYAIATVSDAMIAAEILTLLHAVYGYIGATKLKITTE